jgi:hypothetical protein
MTPAKLFALFDRVTENEQRQDFRFGTLLSNVYNWLGGKQQRDAFEWFGWERKKAASLSGLRNFMRRKAEEGKARKGL